MKKLLIIACIVLAASSICAEKRTIIVYIHGTLVPWLAAVSGFSIITNTLRDTSLYARTVARIRQAGMLETGDMIYGTGLVHVTPLVSLLSTSTDLKYKAALHTIAAFDAVRKACGLNSGPVEYYLFGWNGLLSQRHRKQAGRELFHALYTLQKNIESAGDTASFHLYTHSHGTQLVLYLPEMAQEQGISDFSVDLAVFSGAPLYEPMAWQVYSGMFSTVINFYAPQDKIQTFDIFSIAGTTAVKTFAELGYVSTPSTHIIDVCLTCGDDGMAIGHQTFFLLDRYTTTKKNKAIVAKLTPLPLIVIYPALIPELLHPVSPQAVGNQIDIQLRCEHGQLVARMTSQGAHLADIALPPNLAEAQQCTASAYHNRYLSQFQKIFTSIGYMLYELLGWNK